MYIKDKGAVCKNWPILKGVFCLTEALVKKAVHTTNSILIFQWTDTLSIRTRASVRQDTPLSMGQFLHTAPLSFIYINYLYHNSIGSQQCLHLLNVKSFTCININIPNFFQNFCRIFFSNIFFRSKMTARQPFCMDSRRFSKLNQRLLSMYPCVKYKIDSGKIVGLRAYQAKMSKMATGRPFWIWSWRFLNSISA